MLLGLRLVLRSSAKRVLSQLGVILLLLLMLLVLLRWLRWQRRPRWQDQSSMPQQFCWRRHRWWLRPRAFVSALLSSRRLIVARLGLRWRRADDLDLLAPNCFFVPRRGCKRSCGILSASSLALLCSKRLFVARLGSRGRCADDLDLGDGSVPFFRGIVAAALLLCAL